MNVSKLILIATLAVFFVACDGDEDAPAAQALAYEALTTSVHLEVDDPHTEVFRGWESWSAFWAEHPECNNGCVFSPPYVDFDSSMVAGVFWGLESQAVVDIEGRVRAVERIGDKTRISLGERQFSHQTVMDYAYIFLKFERADGPVEFTGVVPQ